jgi:hypothetical protein
VTEDAPVPPDLGVVTHTCICGSNEWKVVVSFDDYEIATVSTEMYCRWCGAKAVTPTPLDRPGGLRDD